MDTEAGNETSNDMDIDALFADGPALSMPSRPPTAELYRRIDELRGSGCCQAIAWSKWGSIASISPGGTTLELRNLRCSSRDGSWALSEPTLTPPLSHGAETSPLKHLCWGPTGSELAAIDTAGRVTILSLFSSLNKPTLSRHAQLDTADDLHAVVGCYWLNLAPYPQTRPTILHGPAIKDGSGYKYEASQAPVLGPYHPNHVKSAFVCVTTNGMLRVLWPQNNGKWFESHTELESVVSSDDLITHAAICSDKTNTLLIAFATTSKQLRTVRALIDWGIPKGGEKTNVATMPLNPTVKTRHLAATSWLHTNPGDTLNASNMESTMVQLSSLEFLPPSMDSSTKMIPPTIVAVRSHLPVPMSHYRQDVYTTVDRWEVCEKPQSVHPAFEQLSSRRNSIGSQPGSVHFLKRLESFTVNKTVIGMQPMNLGKVICFAYSDSSVDYRDRATMSETFNNGDLDRVWHLSQIGFSYAEDEPCLQFALSPSYCSAVQIRNDGKVRWKRLDYHVGDIGSSKDDPRYAAVAAALAMSCSTAVMASANYDDLLATAHEHAKSNFAYDWLIELSHLLKLHVDYSEEQHFDVLIRNTTIQLCLSIQNSLGFKGDFHPRVFIGKFSWLVLQLRNIVVLVTMAANMNVTGPNNQKASPLEDPEVIDALTGSVRWVLELMAWLADTLLTLPTTLPPSIDLTNANTLSLPDLVSHLHSTNTVSLHLLLSSPTRGFLNAICRRLAHLDYIARKAIMHTIPGHPTANQGGAGQNGTSKPPALSPELRAAYMKIATLTSTATLRITTFETLLSSLTSHIKNAYSTHSPPLSGSPAAEKARNTMEIKMLFGGAIPDTFKGVIVELFRKEGLLDTVRNEIEPARLFFANFAMLEVDDDPVSVRERKKSKMTMDSFRKTWLASPAKKKQQQGGAAGAAVTTTNGTTNGAANGTANGTAPATTTNGGPAAITTPPGAASSTPRWRRCARCAAVMEDVLSQRQVLQWMVMQQRRCFCGGHWETIDPTDIKSMRD